jgi:polyribonucleotide nucleotidyltransferase
MFKEKRHEFEIDGRKAYFSTGKLALKSETAVLAGMGDTVVLVTVNTAVPQGDQEWFPLTIEYMEKMYAAGKISGSRFVKRDKFPTDDATLRARMIDRSIRPRFADDYRNEVQIIVKVMSFDEKNDPAILAINAVSAALMVSKAPFDGPISGVRVGLSDGQLLPMYAHVDSDELDNSSLNMVVAGDGETLTNIDANAYEVPDDQIVESMELGLTYMKPWIDAQKAFVALFSADEIVKPEYTSYAVSEELITKIQTNYADNIRADIKAPNFNEEMKITLEKLYNDYAADSSKREVREAYEKVAKLEVKKMALVEKTRADGRDFTEIRELGVEVGVLPRVHGTGLFTRGLTQVLTTATLGTARNMLLVDDMTGEDERRYLHFYVDEPFSVGEVGRVKYIPSRRSVGHGNLAEKALYPVLPTLEEFPYTMILFSEIMSENGSSSMASTCGSSLALMDAGVPIKKPVAGIAVGIIYEKDLSNYQLVTDMFAVEDFFGGMDFKVAGTRDGVTAIQMDTKTEGLPIKVFKEAMLQSHTARMTILDAMEKAMPSARPEVSPFAPKVTSVKIDQDKIGELIGPGGKNIKALQEETGAEFDINDDGTVNIYATTKDSLDKAKFEVEMYIGFTPEVGQVYEGIVEGIKDFGAFVGLGGGVAGLVHVSEITDGFVKDVYEYVKLGDKVKVKVLGIDPMGKIKLSMKAANTGTSAPKGGDFERSGEV